MTTNLSLLGQTTKKTTKNFVNDRLAAKPIEGSLDITQVSLPTNKDKAYSQSKRVEIYQDRYMSGKILGGRQRDCGCKCIDRGGVAVMQKEGSMHLSGVSTCGSVWACPVCSNKINQQRAIEVSLLLNHYLKGSYSLGMLTLTSQHYIGESCKQVKKKELKAFSKLIVSRKYKDLCKKYSFEGYIRALEVTYGINGWHPHIHLAIVLNNKATALEQFSKEVLGLWLYFNKGTSLQAQDYTPIKDTQGVSKYITKWTASDELVKGNHKTSKSAKGEAPFALLRRATKEGINGDAARLFKEYHNAFKGAKQLTFSKNLQAKLKELVSIKTDEEICNQKQEDAKPVLFLKNDLFKNIVKNKLQAYVLNILESESILELELMLMEFGLFTIYDPDKKTLLLE